MHSFLTDKRLLLVDDNPIIGKMTVDYGRKFEVEIEYIENPQEVREYLASNRIDLIILDIAMPEIDGYQLFAQIKQSHDIPILFLSAKGQEQEKLRGLKLGADDYITKPFSLAELFVRCEQVLKRHNNYIIRDGDIVINLITQRVIYHGKEVKLSPKAVQVLIVLVKSKHAIISREQLLVEGLNQEYYLNERVVDVYINELRTEMPSLKLSTKRSQGYIYEGN